MVERTFAELVKDLRLRRTVGDRPPVLLLGAGASADAGIGAMQELIESFGCADFDSFCKKIGSTSAAERYRQLSKFLQTRTPAEVSPGYQALATLCAEKYFDLVLTTNMDPLLDDALAAARLWRRDYLLIVNGIIRPDRLELLLRGQSPRVKIVKLHGDLFQRFMAWTVEEMDGFLNEISPYLKPAVAGCDFLVVGYSLRDARVRELVEQSGGDVWFTHPKEVPEHLKDNATMRAVVGPECSFEKFFPELAHALHVDIPRQLLDTAQVELRAATPAAASAQTMDDLMTAVFGILGPGGAPVATAFMLAEPRVLVCDRYTVNSLIQDNQVHLVGQSGSKFKTRVLGMNTDSPFGPTLLEVPAGVQASGLGLNPTLLRPGELLHMAVAAGERIGLSSGPVIRVERNAIPIEPVGKVAGLVSLQTYVAPGACGGPVVDPAMAVRGYIVAGTTNPDEPYTLAYPCSEWAEFVRGGKTSKPSKSRGRRR